MKGNYYDYIGRIWNLSEIIYGNYKIIITNIYIVKNLYKWYIFLWLDKEIRCNLYMYQTSQVISIYICKFVSNLTDMVVRDQFWSIIIVVWS